MDSDLWLKVAALVAEEKGTCARRNVGAVLVANGRLREVAWNGMERSGADLRCVEGACPRGQLTKEEQPPGSNYSNCIYLHAESNVLENYRHSAGLRKVKGWGSNITIYISSDPCVDCRAHAEWAGVVLVWSRFS